jgi:hypothetical protein
MAVMCRDLKKNGTVRAWHGHGKASVNQTRPHYVNQMGKTHSKPLAARNGMGAARARHAMCVSALSHPPSGVLSLEHCQSAHGSPQEYQNLLRFPVHLSAIKVLIS